MNATTVYKGTVFEKKCLRLLQDHLSMSLRRVGGKSDGGVDLMGWWWLPSQQSNREGRKRLRVLAQCKAEKKKIGPNYVREMEGVLHRHIHTANAVDSREPTVALFLSESAFTKSTILRAMSSSIPFFLLHVPPNLTGTSSDMDEDDESVSSHIGSAIWNPALGGPSGVLAGKIDVRWERSDALTSGRPGLWLGREKIQSWTPDSAVDGQILEDVDRFS